MRYLFLFFDMVIVVGIIENHARVPLRSGRPRVFAWLPGFVDLKWEVGVNVNVFL